MKTTNDDGSTTEVQTFARAEAVEMWLTNLERQGQVITGYKQDTTGRNGLTVTVTYRPREAAKGDGPDAGR